MLHTLDHLRPMNPHNRRVRVRGDGKVACFQGCGLPVVCGSVELAEMIDDAGAVAGALKCGNAEGFAIRGFVLGGEKGEEDGVGEFEAAELARKRDV